MRSLKSQANKHASIFLVAVSFCPLYIRVGDVASVTVRCAHDYPAGVPYTFTLGPVTSAIEGRATVSAEGHPTGCTWTLNGHEVIFYDDFEGGQLWTSE